MDIEGNKTNAFFDVVRPYIDQSNGAVSLTHDTVTIEDLSSLQDRPEPKPDSSFGMNTVSLQSHCVRSLV